MDRLLLFFSFLLSDLQSFQFDGCYGLPPKQVGKKKKLLPLWCSPSSINECWSFWSGLRWARRRETIKTHDEAWKRQSKRNLQWSFFLAVWLVDPLYKMLPDKGSPHRSLFIHYARVVFAPTPWICFFLLRGGRTTKGYFFFFLFLFLFICT